MFQNHNSAAARQAADRAPAKRSRGRPAGQVATRENILRAALAVFAKNGFAGARVEKISKAAGSTDRMIYYYFGSKEKLFIAVLETIYRELGEAEAALDLAGLNPEDSLRAIVRFTWSYYRQHPEMLAVLNSENLHQGRHVARSRKVRELSLPLISILSDIYLRGVEAKVFRPGIVVRELYIAICSLGYFYLSNRFTLSTFLGTNLMAAAPLEHWQHVMEEATLKFAAAEHPGGRDDTRRAHRP